MIDGRTILNTGTASTAYRQNMLFHKNAIGLAMVPLAMPEGAVNGSRKSHKGLSIRVLPIYDGINDVSKWRMDILYARKCLDGRLGVRLSGTTYSPPTTMSEGRWSPPLFQFHSYRL